MNPIVAGLMIAAVLSAVMSTMDIGLLNVTANAVNDIYYKTLNPNADEKKLGRLSTLGTIASGIFLWRTRRNSSVPLPMISGRSATARRYEKSIMRAGKGTMPAQISK